MSETKRKAVPAWCQGLRISLTERANRLEAEDWEWHGPDMEFYPEDFGYIPGEMATEAIQRAIDAAALQGGTVRLTRGVYCSGTLVFRSHVRLQIDPGAVLRASTNLADYPEIHAKRLTVQDTSMGMHQSLIFAEGCENISLCGEGVLDGMGSPAHFPGEETAQGTPGRPFLIRMIDCKNVLVRGLTMKNAACWMQNYLNCEHLALEGLTVRNHANYNNDGMDLDGCRQVIIRRCRVSSGDDALCFKGASGRDLDGVLVEDCDFYSACNAVKVGTDTQGSFRNVLIRRCRIGGLAEDPSGLKHPCADSGISLESVDGGTVENFWFQQIEITRAWSPFFLRIDDRGRTLPGVAKPAPGSLRRILLEEIHGSGNGPRGSYIMGIPERPVRDVAFFHVRLRQLPWKSEVPREQSYPSFRGDYPDAHMIDRVGPARAYALWTRDAEKVYLQDYAILPEGKDSRAEYVFADG